jgi:hypothetical protein
MLKELLQSSENSFVRSLSAEDLWRDKIAGIATTRQCKQRSAAHALYTPINIKGKKAACQDINRNPVPQADQT